MKFAILMLTAQALRLSLRDDGPTVPASDCAVVSTGPDCAAGDYQCLFSQLERHRGDVADQMACLKGEMEGFVTASTTLGKTKSEKEAAKAKAEQDKEDAAKAAEKAGDAIAGFEKAIAGLTEQMSNNAHTVKEIEDALDETKNDYVYD